MKNTPNPYQIINRYNLEQAYSYVLQNNQSNNLPYHNFGHAEQVMLFSYIGCKFSELTYSATRDILFAALFHDFNHSGGKLKDSENIILAKKGFQDYLLEFDDYDIETQFVNNLIDATEYPYTIETDKLTIEQQIIRDADILQSLFLNNYMQDVVIALAKEWNKTPKECVDMQLNFISNLKFGTEIATKLYNSQKQKVLGDLKLIQRFLSKP